MYVHKILMICAPF